MRFCLENFTSFYLLLFPSPPPHPVAKNDRLSDNEDSLAFAFPAWNIRHNSQKFTKGAKCFKHNVQCKRVSSRGSAWEDCNREQQKSFVPDPSLLEDFWHARYQLKGRHVWMNLQMTSFFFIFLKRVVLQTFSAFQRAVVSCLDGYVKLPSQESNWKNAETGSKKILLYQLPSLALQLKKKTCTLLVSVALPVSVVFSARVQTQIWKYCNFFAGPSWSFEWLEGSVETKPKA